MNRESIKNKLPQDTWGLTEAIYNSYVDLAYVICEMQTREGKGRSLKSGEGSSPGKVFRGRDGERTTVTEKPIHLTGAYGDNDKDPGRVKARMQKNVAMQNPQDPRPGDTELKLKKRFRRLGRKATASDESDNR